MEVNKMENKEEKAVKNCYQGIFVTETVLGNPNGSFVNNEPRNINGRVFTTDKCIKYNVRNYIHQKYENIKCEDGKIKDIENFVFFYPRKAMDGKNYEASFLTKDSVFEKFFDRDFKKLILSCPDSRIFGGTFSFKGGDEKQIYGPVQISYGLDLIGADIINLKVGTPFSTEDGKQKTTGEEYVVDHAVIAYDITVNPNHAPNLLKERDLEMFKEGLIRGTNLRRSTSKKTESKLLIMIKFRDGVTVNVGELKHLIKVKSKKITDPKERPEKLILDMSKVKNRLDKFKTGIEEIEIYYDKGAVELKNFYQPEEKDIEVRELDL